MNMPGYNEKVPENVRNDNIEKIGGYEKEYSANEASH